MECEQCSVFRERGGGISWAELEIIIALMNENSIFNIETRKNSLSDLKRLMVGNYNNTLSSGLFEFARMPLLIGSNYGRVCSI